MISEIKKYGNSTVVVLDRSVLEKVYGLHEGSKIEIEYKYPLIIIKGGGDNE